MKFTSDGAWDSDGKILRIIPVIEFMGGYRAELPATYYHLTNDIAGWREGEAALSPYRVYSGSQAMLGPGPLAGRIAFIVEVLENMSDVGPYTVKWVDGEPIITKVE